MNKASPVLLLTRPEAASQRFVRAIAKAGVAFEPVISPLMEIVMTGAEVDTADVRGMIFTSPNGVWAWKERNRNVDVPTYVVGPATAQAAKRIGLTPAIMRPTVSSLATAMLEANLRGPLLHLHGHHVTGHLAERLNDAGVSTKGVIVYDQPEKELDERARSALLGEVPVVAPVFSPRSAGLLARERARAPLLVAAMSEAVAFNLAPLHIVSLTVAKRPDSAAMEEAVLQLLNEAQARMM